MTLHLLGDGKERENLQAQINRLGLQDRVFLDGIKSNIQDEYRDASFLVSSSRWEGFPMVILEAESTGIPVIAFDCPCGPSDLIADGENGFLVADGDIDKLADRIIYLIEHSGKRKEMGRKAFESARKYSQENVIKMWTDLFDELSAKGKK